MLDKNNAAGVVAALKAVYPAAQCSLSYEGEPWKLLVMAILSAQCTDKRVNIVSEELFRRFDTPLALASGSEDEVEALVKQCGLYRTKAKNIRAACAKLCADYHGVVPDTLDELLTLPGVGRKIANLIVGDVYGKPAIVTDTHCIRLAGRFGLCGDSDNTPVKVERRLAGLIEPEEQSDFCHRLVLFGREYCTARSPKCGVCPLSGLCEKRGVEGI